MKDKRNDYKLVFKTTYHPNFSNLKVTVSFLHFLLILDQEHQQVFHKAPIIGFRRAKSLKDILVRKIKAFMDHVTNRDVKYVSTL